MPSWRSKQRFGEAAPEIVASRSRARWSHARAAMAARSPRPPGRRAPLDRCRSGASRGDRPAPRRFCDRRPARCRRGACELCARAALPPEHRHVVNLGDAQPALRLPAVLICCSRTRRGGRQVPLGSRALPLRPRSRAHRARSGTRCRSRSASRSSSTTAPSAAAAAFYPSPAGATESLLPLETWEELAAANPLLASLEPDVEALLVCKRRRAASSASSCRSTPATSWSAASAATGRASTAARRRGRRSTASSPPAREKRRADADRPASVGIDRADLTLHGRRRARRAVRGGADAGLPAAASRRRRGERIHAIALRCQIRIEPHRRRYSSAEQAKRLLELFGEPARWGDTLKPLLWTHVTVDGAGFHGRRSTVDLPVTCTYDFEVAAAKYFQALDDGEIPLLFLFSGTVFTRGATGFSVEQVPWEKEAAFRLPVRVWRELMDHYFPGSAWIRLRRETLDALQRFKAERALPTWDDAVERRCSPTCRAQRGAVMSFDAGRRRSPTPCSTRVTCSIPTAPRRRRTRCASSSASSRRAPTREAGGSEPWQMQTECPRSSPATGRRRRCIDFKIRFLQLQERTRSRRRPAGDAFRPVEFLDVGDGAAGRLGRGDRARARDARHRSSASWRGRPSGAIAFELPGGSEIEELRSGESLRALAAG